jgi:hypothetical protein
MSIGDRQDRVHGVNQHKKFLDASIWIADRKTMIARTMTAGQARDLTSEAINSKLPSIERR